MKRALITGINGFVGPYLEKELRDHGYDVFGLGREDVTRPNYYCIDVTQEQDTARAVAQIQPTHIFHLAGISWPMIAEKEPVLTHAVNVIGTKHILDAAKQMSVPTRVLVVGSSHVYGRPETVPVREDHPLSGTSVYARSRIDQEALVATYESSVPIVVTRSFNHTGPGQDHRLITPKIVRGVAAIKLGLEQMLELGNTRVKRDIADVRDVVRAYRVLLEQDQFPLTVNVCRGESRSLKKIIDYATVLAELSEIRIEKNPDFVRPNDVEDVYGDTDLLRSVVDWKPEYSYEQMVRDLYAYWINKLSS
jgi:GDP-D-mannose dehydratase